MAGGLAADANAGGDVVADERPRGLRRLDRLSTPVGLGLGMGVGAILTWGLFAWGPTAGLVGGLLLLGGAAALAYSAEPVWDLEEMARPRPEPEPQPTPPGAVESAVPVEPAELLDLVPLSGGEFVMGSSPATDPGHYEDEAPRRRVRVSPLRMARVPVTQAQYREVMGENPSEDPQGPELPVNNVSWLDAVRFCNALSERERLASCYEISEDNQVRWRREANGYRLPTEAEWEYAARAGTTTPYPFDEAELAAHAWYEVNSGNQVQPVGMKLENPFGLQDLLGNVWEWCWDGFAPYEARPAHEQVAEVADVLPLPVGEDVNDIDNSIVIVNPSGPLVAGSRVVRGGSAWSEPRGLRAAYRGRIEPGNRNWYFGFRCVRSGRRQP